MFIQNTVKILNTGTGFGSDLALQRTDLGKDQSYVLIIRIFLSLSWKVNALTSVDFASIKHYKVILEKRNHTLTHPHPSLHNDFWTQFHIMFLFASKFLWNKYHVCLIKDL